MTSAAGLEDPKNPGAKWDPSKTSLSDFYEYLRGAAGANGDTGADGKDGVDGKDGSDGKDGADGKDGVDGKDGADGSNGKSAYDLWKELVLSEEGLDNPDNGVYDISIFPKWPTFAVSVADFYEYLRGRNGEDGEPGEKIAATDTMYVEEADWTKYNVAPVRALAKVRMNGAVKDTTYEYVNPYSGGCALVVTGPGPVIIPDCTVRFKDQTGRSYTKTSDASGYIYLEREALPDWVEGSPSIYDLSSRTKPESFSFGEKTISDPDRIAATCGVPYKVGMSVRMTGSSWDDGYVTADYLVTRTVEGIEESGWGGLSFPQCSGGGLGYFYYRSLGDLMSFRKYSFGRFGQQPNDYSQGDHFIKFSTRDVVRRWSRPVGTVASERTEPVIFGDGKAPSVVGIHHIPVSGSGQAAIYSDYLPDYGIQSASASETIIPEYCTIGALDVSGLKGGKGDAAFTSDNDKLVMSADGTEKVAVNRTNYELILGQTSFSFSFDYSTFGHVYLKKSYYDESSDVYRFRRYDTFVEYLAATKPSDSGSNVTTLAISGMLGGVSIKNTVGVSLYVSNGNIQAASRGPFIIRNVYNNFELQFVQFKYRDAYYGKTTGKFRYKEADPYVASCTLGDDTYTFQAIKDGVSAPLP